MWVLRTLKSLTIHAIMMQFISRYTACDTLNNMMFAIHISELLFIQELSVGED